MPHAATLVRRGVTGETGLGAGLCVSFGVLTGPRAATIQGVAMERKWRKVATGAALLAIATLFTAGALAGCGGGAPQTSPLPTATTAASATPSPTPSPTPTIAFEPWPPGTASAAQALAVVDKYAARTKAETLATADLLAADSTLDVWLANEHLKGADVVDYFTKAPEVLDWSRGTVLAAVGAAAVECTVTNVDAAITMRCLEVLTIGDGKITHLEVYGNGTESDLVAPPKPVGMKPGPADTAAAAKAAVTAYFTALAKGDMTAAAAPYSPQVVFQDTTVTGKAGGAQAAIAWHTKLVAVPNMSMEPKSVIAGKGWAVARWLLSGETSPGTLASVRGATVFEVRGGKIVRQTLYYNFADSPFR
jgi:ketosteroid isomerase-like protein